MTEKTFEELFPSLKEEMFESIWQAIKKWDIERSPGDLYAGTTGYDVRTIIQSIEKDLINHCLDKQFVERDYVKKEPNEIFGMKIITKDILKPDEVKFVDLDVYSQAISKSMAEIQEAFILEQTKPFFDYDEKKGIATAKQSIKLRLVEIEDYKQKVRDAVDKFIPTLSRNLNLNNKGRLLLRQTLEEELGI